MNNDIRIFLKLSVKHWKIPRRTYITEYAFCKAVGLICDRFLEFL